MNRNGLIVLLVAVVAGVACAVVLGACGSGSSGSHSAASPACLPATVDHSAKLAGLPVDVSPAPGTGTASPHTQISFLGVPVSEIHAVSVAGQRSGPHTGRLQGYSQGDGASFVPDTPFDPGERVVVHATIGGGGGDAGRFGASGAGVSRSGRAGASQSNESRSGGASASQSSASRTIGGASSQSSESQAGGAGASQSSASRTIGGGGTPVAFGFRVDTPYPTAAVSPFPNPPAAPADYQSFYTLPGVQAPILTVAVADRDSEAGDVLTTNGPGPGQYGPLIYTPRGRLVWFDRLPDGEAAEDLNVQSYEGRRDLTWWRGHVLSLGFGQGEDVVMNSRYRTVARVPGGNGLKADLHEFQLAPHGVAYITAYNPIRCNLAPLQGARDGAIVDTAIQEIDVKTGLVRWEWHSLDHVPASESETPTATDTKPWDWFHLNSIDVEGAGTSSSGDLFISARSTWAGYQLQGGTGRVLWRLGGLASSFKMGPGTQTAWQHDGRVLPDGEVTFFDDGANPPIHRQSRAVRIALDFATHEARLAAAYTHPDPPLLAASQGNAQTLPDGATVVGYGGVPAISEYTQGGALAFDAHLPYDMTFYRAFRLPWQGRPASPPAVLASLNDTSEETVVHASWNGATEVASWRVLAGNRPGALQPQTVVPFSGFESSTTLPKRYTYAAVQALDSAGRVLGASRAVRVIGFDASLPSAGGRPG